ncbi:MAG: hypothetical protein ACLR2E_24785 [Lachnospiraceae bacterium]
MKKIYLREGSRDETFSKRYSGFGSSMEVQLAYRESFFVQSISSLVGIMVSIFLWKALFAEQSTVQGYDWNQMILYALIAALSMLR